MDSNGFFCMGMRCGFDGFEPGYGFEPERGRLFFFFASPLFLPLPWDLIIMRTVHSEMKVLILKIDASPR